MGAENSRRHRSSAIVSDNLSSTFPNGNSVRHKRALSMDRLRRTLSFHSKSNDYHSTTNRTKPLQWQDDEKAVRAGTCNFKVKYLGSIEVQESQGMHVGEQAMKALLSQKVKFNKSVLNISGDALRVIDGTNKGLIVDQTIEKISYCGPDRRNEKGFTYICRDVTTRRWLCHGFLTMKETGERLSHAVGCAFQICLERKQKRDRECSVLVEYTQHGTSFTRFGSFRRTSIIERIIDPQSVIVTEPIRYISNQKNNVTERPRPKGNNSKGFNRSNSMRSNDINQISINALRQQSSSNLPSLQEPKYKESLTNTIPEEIESLPKADELSYDSTNTNTESSIIPISPPSCIPDPPQHTNQTTINDAFSSNLNALAQSNHPTNPFSPYAYSMAAQAQSPNNRQSSIFTPRRGTNPFDDDLIRR